MPLSNAEHLEDRAARRRKRLLKQLASFNLAVAALLTALVIYVVDASRDAVVLQIQNAADSMAVTAQLSIKAELDRIDAVLSATADEVQRLTFVGMSSEVLLQEVLATRLQSLEGVDALRMADVHGKVRLGIDLLTTAALDIGDQDYFQAAQSQAGATPVLSGPLRSSLSGRWVIKLVRPLFKQDKFDGVLYADVSLEHFQALFDRYELRDRDALTLRAVDARLLARRSPGSASQGEVGQAAVSSQLLAAVGANASSGSYVSTAPIDGVERTTAYRTVAGWPLIVYAGVHNARYLQPWVAQAWTAGALAALSWLLVLLASRAAYISKIRQAKVLESLAMETRQTQALLRVAGDGIHILDARGHLVEMSDSFAQMLRSSREALLGRHVSTWDVNQDRVKIDAWLAKIKVGDRQRVEVQHRRDDGTIIDVELHLSAAEIGGELLVFGSGRDVTHTKRLVREQSTMLESDLVGMVRVENGIIGWRNRAFERLFGFSVGELEGQPVRLLYAEDQTYLFAREQAGLMLRDGTQRRLELPMRRRTGEPIWIAVSGMRLSETQTFWMAVDITDAKKAHEQLTYTAHHDALTGLPNRLLMRVRLQKKLTAAAAQGKSLAVCYLDLDGFKAINDERGHEAGDLLLVQIARRIESSLRAEDLAFRLGGDEFVIVLAPSDTFDWQRLLDGLVRHIAHSVTLEDAAVTQVEATIGVAVSTPNDVDADADSLLEQADEAMLRGKRYGKGRVWWASALIRPKPGPSRTPGAQRLR